MVMENLSFGRSISRQYDLKGALHARFTSTGNGAGDVLLDQNFVNDMNVSPLYVSRKSKRNLQRAVWNDTTFLHVSFDSSFTFFSSKSLVCLPFYPCLVILDLYSQLVSRSAEY